MWCWESSKGLSVAGSLLEGVRCCFGASVPQAAQAGGERVKEEREWLL